MKALKDILIAGCLSIIILSLCLNMFRQVEGLRRAARVNFEMEEKVRVLEAEKKRLEEMITVASEKSYMEGQLRELLGLGSQDDYWVKLPEDRALEEVYPSETAKPEKSNWEKWFEMFTD